MKFYLCIAILISAITITACTGPASNDTAASSGLVCSSSSSKTVIVNWSANRETAVNTTGGGYYIYYCDRQLFDITDGDVTKVQVPFLSGTKSPTSKQITLPDSGTYYFKITAYSSLGGIIEGAPSNLCCVSVR